MEVSREDLVRILGLPRVRQVENLPEKEWEERKWERLSDLLYAYEKLRREPTFEARRSCLLGLDMTLQTLLARHILRLPTGE